MSFPVLEQYKKKYPPHKFLLEEFQSDFTRKLWHQLSKGILIFIFQRDVHGKLAFDFYLEFVKKFDRNIDQITHLKILKQCLTNMDPKQAIEFLQKFQEKDAYTDEAKAIVAALRANYYVKLNLEKCSQIYHRLQKFAQERKDADPFTFSCFYRFAMNYFSQKNKQKLFYDHALQYMSHTPAQEIQEFIKVDLLANMGIALLTSKEIYNFSELMEQPMLRSLADSPYRWVFELLSIFNKGDIKIFNEVIDEAMKRNGKLKDKKIVLEQKIRLMAFLEMAFNLPKSNRVMSFEQVATTCSIPSDSVQFLVMKAASLNLVKVQINQINKEILVTWVAPKVLGNQKISTMLKKFEEWNKGVEGVQNYISQNRKIVRV